MVSRREILQTGIAVGSLPIATSAAWATGDAARTAPLPALHFYKVIFDQRFAASRLFGREAARRGAAVHAIDGDITDVWYHDLHARWRAGPAAIAGLTAHGAIFCLERLAWDVGMRVVFRAEHERTTAGTFAHVFDGPESMIRSAAALAAPGTDWSCHIATIVMNCPSEISGARRKQMFAAAAPATEDQHPLISWVIAPVRRA